MELKKNLSVQVTMFARFKDFNEICTVNNVPISLRENNDSLFSPNQILSFKSTKNTLREVQIFVTLSMGQRFHTVNTRCKLFEKCCLG